MSNGHLIEAWFDGVCEPVNPGGHAAWGIRVCVDGKESHTAGGYCGAGEGMSNNVAEYSGVIAAMKWVRQAGLAGILTIRGDSKLVIQQLNRAWKAKEGHYVGAQFVRHLYFPFYQEAAAILDELKHTLGGVELVWIPRDENAACDYYSKKVLLDRGIKFRIQPTGVAK